MCAYAKTDSCSLVKTEQMGLSGVLIQTRETIENKIDELYGDNSALMSGILLGDKRNIDDSVITSFRDSGIAHLLAVSGMNTAIIAAALLFLLRLFKLRQKSIFIITSLSLIFFCAITDFSPSIVRATIMALFVLAAKLFGKRQDTLSSLFAAGILILLFDPYSLFKIGFQLSFAAVFGILCLMDKLNNIFAFLPKGLREALSVSISAQCGVLLITAYYFNYLNIYSPITNVLVTPIIGVLVIAATISVILGFILGFLAIPLVFASNILLSLTTGIASVISSFPNASYIIGEA